MMKRIVLETYGKIIGAILTLLGIITTSCVNDTPAPEYGVPSADFVVKGKVTDRVSQKPINNIAVIRKARTSPYGNDTIKTNPNGEFELKFNDFPGVNHWIYAKDLDGTENGGLYEPDSLTVNSSQMKRIKRGSGWYEGVFEKKDADFTLTHSPSIPMYGVPATEYKEIKNDNQ